MNICHWLFSEFSGTRRRVALRRFFAQTISPKVGQALLDQFPWMLLNCLKGINMVQAVYSRLSSEQACSIARQIARVLTSIHSLAFAGCGTLVRRGAGLAVGKPK